MSYVKGYLLNFPFVGGGLFGFSLILILVLFYNFSISHRNDHITW